MVEFKAPTVQLSPPIVRLGAWATAITSALTLTLDAPNTDAGVPSPDIGAFAQSGLWRLPGARVGASEGTRLGGRGKKYRQPIVVG